MDPLVGTKNFRPAEWERESSGGRTPDVYREIAQATLELLQRVRDVLGVPVLITDAWRSMSDNTHTVGSSSSSQHLVGAGVDFNVPSLTKHQVAAALDAAEASGELTFRQLIYYTTDNHYHLGAGTGNQKLIKIDGQYEPYNGPDSIPGGGAPAAAPAVDPTLWLALAALATAAGFILTRKR